MRLWPEIQKDRTEARPRNKFFVNPARAKDVNRQQRKARAEAKRDPRDLAASGKQAASTKHGLPRKSGRILVASRTAEHDERIEGAGIRGTVSRWAKLVEKPPLPAASSSPPPPPPPFSRGFRGRWSPTFSAGASAWTEEGGGAWR